MTKRDASKSAIFFGVRKPSDFVICYFSFHATLQFPLINTIVNIDQGSEKKVHSTKKMKNQHVFSYLFQKYGRFSRILTSHLGSLFYFENILAIQMYLYSVIFFSDETSLTAKINDGSNQYFLGRGNELIYVIKLKHAE